MVGCADAQSSKMMPATNLPIFFSVVRVHNLDGAQRGRGWFCKPCR
jgi:hypothetical protein